MANPVSLTDVKLFFHPSSVDRERVYGSTNLSSTRRQTVAEITHLFICFISVLFQVNSSSVGTQLRFRGILHSLADGWSTGSESVAKRRCSSSSECLWQAQWGWGGSRGSIVWFSCNEAQLLQLPLARTHLVSHGKRPRRASALRIFACSSVRCNIFSYEVFGLYQV